MRRLSLSLSFFLARALLPELASLASKIRGARAFLLLCWPTMLKAHNRVRSFIRRINTWLSNAKETVPKLSESMHQHVALDAGFHSELPPLRITRVFFVGC